MDFISQIIEDVVESVVEERWLPVVGYEGLYEVSDLGRVRSLKSGKIMKPKLEKNGYMRTCLTNNKQEKTISIHRLILQTFQPTEEKLQCDHINHIKTDNRLVNLRWATISQNSRFRKKREGLSSQYMGVAWAKYDKKWKTGCRIDGKTIHLGYFDDEREAGLAYNNFVISKGLQDFVILNEIN
jgi:hypothetical protein